MDKKTDKKKYFVSSAPNLERLYIWSGVFFNTLASLLKVLCFSKKTSVNVSESLCKDVVILANGPSLKDFLDQKRLFWESKDRLTVNHACKSPIFTEIRPQYHVFADPAFFNDSGSSTTFDVIAQKVTWKFFVFVPFSAKKQPLWREKHKILQQNPYIHVRFFNMTKVSGFDSFVNHCVKRGWGLPSPRNVLVPSIAHCLRMGYKNIYLAGADHSWIKELWVNDNNEVMIDDRHYYDSASSNVHQTAHLSLVLESIAIALNSYSDLERYAKCKNAKIYNITPGSYIDVFERMKV
ncbi:MAG: hypothetical protein NC396_01760 [Bacteroides sp.]|nr:hypothetical protein [Bacteroides sp.]MCM1084917.1 hypothetical protein [Bacteroides sp.]